MAKPRRHPDQADLFEVATLYPVRAPQSFPRALDFNRRIAMAMSEAIRQSSKSREAIAAEMTEILGYEDSAVTLAQLNAYTACSRDTHTISLVRFVAFVRATGLVWLWDEVLRDEGLTVMEGEEVRLAHAGALRKQAEQLLAQADAALAAAPSKVRIPRGRA